MMTVCGFMNIPMGYKVVMPDHHDGDNGWAAPRRIYHGYDPDQSRGLFLSRKDAMWRWWQAECIVDRMNARSFEIETVAQALVAQYALGAEMAADLETEITRNEMDAARQIRANARRSATVKRKKQRLRAQYHRGARMAAKAEDDIVTARMDEITEEVGRYVLNRVPPLSELGYCERHSLYRNPKSMNYCWMCREESKAVDG